jgi:hypothetical protein
MIRAQAAESTGGEEGADEGRGEDAFGMVRGQQQGALRARGERYESGLVGAGGVHHRERVGGELRLCVCAAAGRPVRTSVAARIERQDTEMTRQVRDLRLPAARVDDRPGWQEQDRWLAVAVALSEHPHAVALDMAVASG